MLQSRQTDNTARGTAVIGLQISEHNQARLAEAARRQGLSVDAYLERLMSEQATAAPASGLTGAALLAVLQASPYRDIDFTPQRVRLPVRDIEFQHGADLIQAIGPDAA